MSEGANDRGGKCPGGKRLGGKRPPLQKRGQMSGGKCPGGQMSYIPKQSKKSAGRKQHKISAAKNVPVTSNPVVQLVNRTDQSP